MYKIILFIAMAFLACITTADALTVDVFTTSNLGVGQSVVLNPLSKNENIQVFKLDQLEKLQQGLNQSIKSSLTLSDKNALKKITKQWVSTNRSAYIQMTSAIAKVYQDNVTEIPAIVFNHQYAVLGTVNINQAYQIYLNKVSDNHD